MYRKTIPNHLISYITYEPKSVPYLRTLSALSTVSLLILAPLNAYNFSNSTINSASYVGIAGPSIIACAIFPFLYFHFETAQAVIGMK